MRQLFLVAASFALIWTATTRAETEHAHITVLATTDLHGHMFPENYFTNQPEQNGLAKIATLIRKAREKAPNLLLLDCGDVIQGTPFAYYHNRINNTPPDPMMTAMNALGYVSMTPGNHEFNFGLDVLRKAQGEARFPWISANILREGSDTPAFDPYVIKEVDGVRIAILGLTTPLIPTWEDIPNYRGLAFANPVATAQKWVPILREKERADIVIVAMHMGLERELGTNLMTDGNMAGENAAIEIATTVPGIDLILMGHTHREIPSLIINNVLLAQAGKWGAQLVRADLYLERPSTSSGTAPARWTINARSSCLLPVTSEIKPDPEISALAEPYERETQAWLKRTIGVSAKELSSKESRLQDTALIDLIQRVQLDAAKAQISFAACFTLDAKIPSGPVSVRDIYSLYTYENTLLAVEMTGAQVKAALEHAARYFRSIDSTTTASPGQPATETHAGDSRILINDMIPGYNYDMAEGVSYTIDLAKPVGERITHLSWQGKPVDPSQKFRVAVNNYRFNGGGGYTMFKEGKVLWRSPVEIRDLLIDWVTEHREIPVEATENWHIKTSAEK